MADDIYAWAREALLNGDLDLSDTDAVIVLADTEPDLSALTLADVTGQVGERGESTWLVSVANPPQASLATGPTVDPDPDEAAWWVVCVGSITDDDIDIRPVRRVQLLDEDGEPAPTSDPVEISTAALLTLAGELSAPEITYAPATPDDWPEGAPSDVAAGLDTLAAREAGTGGGSVDSVAGIDPTSGDIPRAGLVAELAGDTAADLAAGDHGHPASAIEVETDDDPVDLQTVLTGVNAQVSGHTDALNLKADLVDGVVPTSQLPAVASTVRVPVANQAARLALTADDVQPGDLAIQLDTATSWLLGDPDPSDTDSWVQVDNDSAVASVNGQTGTVVLGASDVGAAPTSRLVSAGTGLTGGGSLVTDRTLAADFGTGAGKVTQGNDSRLSDARTPTAHKTSHATGGGDALVASDIGAAAASHNHAGSDINSGTIPTARLGSGTANSGTSLRGDNTWVAVPAAMASLPRTTGEYYTLGGRETAATGGAAQVAGTLRSHPVWLAAGTYDRVAVFTTVAAVSTWRIGVYPANTTTLLPDGQSLLLDCGTIDTNLTAGLLTATVSLTIPTSGIYWLAVLLDAYTARPTVWGWHGVAGNTPNLPWLGHRSQSSVGARGDWCRTVTGVTTGSMPATYPTSTGVDTVPQVQVRAA